jgi:hypothetical protein
VSRALCLLVAVALFSCKAKGAESYEYWVKGLTLPPGSTVLSKTETSTETTAASGAQNMPIPEKALVVIFTSTTQPASAKAYIDNCLTSQGYTPDNSNAFGTKLSGDMKDMAQAVHSYVNQGSLYRVSLTDMAESRKAASKWLKQPPPTNDPGGYMLTVVKMKK